MMPNHYRRVRDDVDCGSMSRDESSRCYRTVGLSSVGIIQFQDHPAISDRFERFELLWSSIMKFNNEVQLESLIGIVPFHSSFGGEFFASFRSELFSGFRTGLWAVLIRQFGAFRGTAFHERISLSINNTSLPNRLLVMASLIAFSNSIGLNLTDW